VGCQSQFFGWPGRLAAIIAELAGRSVISAQLFARLTTTPR
jgi:hypothetical protein